MKSRMQSLIGWGLILVLLMLWTGYKARQADEMQRRAQADSLAVESRDKAAPRGETALGPEEGVQEPGGAAPADTPAGGDGALAGGDNAAPDTSQAQAALKRRQITVETNHFTVELDNLGAKVNSLRIKDLEGLVPFNPELIPPDRGGALNLELGPHDLGEALWQVEAEGGRFRVMDRPLEIAFHYRLPGGGAVERTYTFFPDSAKFSHELVAPDQGMPFSVEWEAGLNETEEMVPAKGFGLLSTYFSEVVLSNGSNVLRQAVKEKQTFNEESGVLRWVGLRRKYAAAVMNFNREVPYAVTAEVIPEPGLDQSIPRTYGLEVSGRNYEPQALDFDFVVLPLSYEELLARDEDYEKILFSGWEWFFRADIWYVGLCGLVLKLLKFFYALIPNYGIAIILLTLLVRIVTFPLTVSQTKSAAKMQVHAPAIQKIREKYRSQPQKMNQEIMAYYQKAGVNPFASMLGCFPVLLQMPIFIALFNVLGRAVELKNAGFVGWINDLSHPDVILPALKVPYIFPLGLTVLPFLMAATMYFQMKMTVKDPNQKFMIWMMPIMMFVFSCSFPSGLVLYWTVSNIFTIGQTYFYTSKMRPDLLPAGETAPAASKPAKPRTLGKSYRKAARKG